MKQLNAKVIVVDDEPVIRQFMLIALNDLGCSVETFSTYAEGLKRVERCDFDVAFVDKNLSDGTGLKICEKLEGANCKVALVTGYANLNSAVEAMRHGVADYFIKPLDIDDLAARLSKMLEQLNLERSNQGLLSELKRKCQLLESLATRDTVTSLFNHSHFQQVLRAEVERSTPSERFSLALLAIDDFSKINEEQGHQAGDELLRALGSMLSGTRAHGASPLGPQDMAARIKGGTFSIVLPETPRNTAAAKLRAVRGELAALAKNTEQLPPTMSIGVAEYPKDGTKPLDLLESAEAALKKAKDSGGNCTLFFDSTEQWAGENPNRQKRALLRYLDEKLVRFVYQPIVSLSGRKPYAYEALCRPTTQDFKHVGQLLDVAGEAGRLGELGQVLRDVAVGPMADLPTSQHMFLNVHPQELDCSELFCLPAHVKQHAERIVLELTEVDYIRDYKRARDKLRQLRDWGFRIALDDFGAGYQGFNSLAKLEPDYVKLDMGIVRGIRPNSRAARLAKHLREFCESEGIRTIAEGVETITELSTLADLGFDLLQGYYFARPSEPFCSINLPGHSTAMERASVAPSPEMQSEPPPPM